MFLRTGQHTCRQLLQKYLFFSFSACAYVRMSWWSRKDTIKTSILTLVKSVEVWFVFWLACWCICLYSHKLKKTNNRILELQWVSTHTAFAKTPIMCNLLVPGEVEGKGGKIQENQKRLRALKNLKGSPWYNFNFIFISLFYFWSVGKIITVFYNTLSKGKTWRLKKIEQKI